MKLRVCHKQTTYHGVQQLNLFIHGKRVLQRWLWHLIKDFYHFVIYEQVIVSDIPMITRKVLIQNSSNNEKTNDSITLKKYNITKLLLPIDLTNTDEIVIKSVQQISILYTYMTWFVANFKNVWKKISFFLCAFQVFLDGALTLPWMEGLAWHQH